MRKTRIPAQQKGKLGGARIIYYYYNESIPLFLLDIYQKSEKVNVTKSELNVLRKIRDKVHE